MPRFHDVRVGFLAGWRESRRLRWVAPVGVMLGGGIALFVVSHLTGG